MATPDQKTDPRAARAAVNPAKLALLVVQLAVIFGVFWGFRLDSPVFLTLSAGCFLSFLVHYFVPFAYKKQAFIALSLLVGFIVVVRLSPQPSFSLVALFPPLVLVGLAVALGLAFYTCLRLPIPFAARIMAIIAVAAAIASVIAFQPKLMPPIYWAILAAIFMFRMILYAYDARVARQPEKLVDFMSYFFLMPNFYFVLFPVIDYTTFKKSYYADDIHRTAQQGIAWIVRGTVHLCLYRVLYHLFVIPAGDVHSFGTMMQYVFMAYPLYLRVSGNFHIIVGMLHLFGFKLPRTNNLYFLASSPTDFWRRVNIYWKDFMVKIFYYPTYFVFRKRNETLALVVATIVVFIATCLLHSYQWYWITGLWELGTTDLVFWTVLGVVVIFAVLRESRAGPPKKKSPAVALTQRIVSTIAMYLLITLVWSIWSSTSITGWIDTVVYWK